MNHIVHRTFQEAFETSVTPVEYRGNLTFISPKSPNVHVLYSLFIGCTSNSEDGGGAICCYDRVEKLLVSQSSFTSCTTSKSTAGAIFYYKEDDSHCVLHEVCSYQCASTSSGSSQGQFAYIYVEFNDISNIKQVNDSSIAQSRKDEISKQKYSLYLENGKISLQSVNLTNNECYRYPALFCSPYLQSDQTPSSVACFIGHTFIVNNTATDYGCIDLFGASSLQYIHACNIIKNEQNADNTGMIYSNAQLHINCSNILGNNKCLFHEYDDNSQIILTECSIDDDVKTSSRYKGNVVIESTIQSLSINEYANIATKRCDLFFKTQKITKRVRLPCEIRGQYENYENQRKIFI